jgi:TM2 domain-containing membrane protein YozV
VLTAGARAEALNWAKTAPLLAFHKFLPTNTPQRLTLLISQQTMGMSSKQSASNKDPNTAMVIEIVAGYFGFLGIGYLYAGRTVAGLLRLFGWWAFIIVAVLVVTTIPFAPLLAVGPLGDATRLEAGINLFGSGLVLSMIGLCCLVVIALAVPVISGLMLKGSLSAEQNP